MHHNLETSSPVGRAYLSPAVRIIPLLVENAICESSVPGGNEDIGYEDWD